MYSPCLLFLHETSYLFNINDVQALRVTHFPELYLLNDGNVLNKQNIPWRRVISLNVCLHYNCASPITCGIWQFCEWKIELLNEISHRVKHTLKYNIKYILYSHTQLYILLDYITLYFQVHAHILFFTNLMHKFFILIYLLHSSTWFERYFAHLQEDSVLTRHLVSPLSLDDCSVHSLRQSSRNLCTEQSPKGSDDTRCCTNTIVLLKMSTIVVETCRGM